MFLFVKYLCRGIYFIVLNSVDTVSLEIAKAAGIRAKRCYSFGSKAILKGQVKRDKA